jgi:glutaredoxin
MWVIVGRTQCNFCDSAKAVLKGMNIQYTEYHVDSPSSRWLLTLIRQAKHRSVPQIFDDGGNYIGGYSDLIKHLNLE